MNYPTLISRPLTATELRDRALASMNGESVALSKQDSERRRRVLEVLRRSERTA